MEFWDIYDADKKPTGRTMKRNDHDIGESTGLPHHTQVLLVFCQDACAETEDWRA